MKTNLKRLAVLVALGSAWIAPAALGQSTVAPVHVEGRLPSTRVSYADLAVDTPAGLASLTRRIDTAVRQVCALDARSRRLREFGTARACMRTASADAWEQFGQNQERAFARSRAIVMSANRRSAH